MCEAEGNWEMAKVTFKIYYEIDGKKKTHYSLDPDPKNAMKEVIDIHFEECKAMPFYVRERFGTDPSITPKIYKITSSKDADLNHGRSILSKIFSCQHFKGGYWTGDSPGAGLYVCKDCRQALKPYSKELLPTGGI